VNLILIEPGGVRDGRATLAGAQARHAIDVLRVTPGQELRLGVIDGPRAVGRVTRVDGAHVELECTFGEVPPVPDVDLLLALPRPKVLRRLWAQLAALGVRQIMLTNAARVERNYFDTHVLEPEVYRPLLIEGLQQAQDTHLPRVSVHRRFKPLVEDALDTLCPDGVRLVAHPHGGGAPAAWPPRASHTLLAVGPEGGWDEYEMGLLAARDFTPISLGPRTLRTDTACIALLAVLRAGAPSAQSRSRG
jgi:16S rRNA (uracil1498-N3)-methyltransferase